MTDVVDMTGMVMVMIRWVTDMTDYGDVNHSFKIV